MSVIFHYRNYHVFAFIILSVAVCTIYIVYKSNWMSQRQGKFMHNGQQSKRNSSGRITEVEPDVSSYDLKTILWYDTHRQSMVVYSSHVTFSECRFKACQIKYVISRKDLRPSKPFVADAILVQSKAIFTLSPPPRRDENQAFVLAVRDTFPAIRRAHEDSVARQWITLFNWTMTYRLDSDIIYKYSNIIAQNKSQNSFEKYEKVFLKKTKNVLWLVSHCITKSLREYYVSDLKRAIDVDIYGHCGKKAACPKGDHSCFETLAKKYKFYLAFENTFYADYVTEKVFNWFNRDLILVVRGGANYSRILPSGTYIDSADFDSPAELGHFLKGLAVDKNRYISYLKRKDLFYSTSKFVPTQEAYCKLCEYLHTPDFHRKTCPDIVQWWTQGKITY